MIDKFFSSTILAFRMLCKENKSVNLLVSINYRFARDPTFQFRFAKKNIESNGVLFCRKGRRVKVQKSKGWRSFSRSIETRSSWFTGDLPPTPRIISRAKLIAKKFTSSRNAIQNGRLKFWTIINSPPKGFILSSDHPLYGKNFSSGSRESEFSPDSFANPFTSSYFTTRI